MPFIVFDLDGVLYNLVGLATREFGIPNNDKSYRMDKWWDNVSPSAVSEFLSAPSTYQRMKPIPGSQEALREIQEAGYDIVYCTKRPRHLYELTVRKLWVEFPIAPVLFQTEYPTYTKAQLLKYMRYRPVLAVEDSMKEAQEYIQEGVQPILLSASYNHRTRQIPRFDTWADITYAMGVTL